MTVETDTLAVLQKLEKLMRTSSAMAGAAKDRQAETFKRSDQNEDKSTRKTILASVGSLDTLGKRADRASVNLHNMNIKTRLTASGLGVLTGVVGKAVQQFTTASSELKVFENLFSAGANDAMFNFSQLVKSSNEVMTDTVGHLRGQLKRSLGTAGFGNRIKQLDKALTGNTGTGGLIKQVTRASWAMRGLANTANARTLRSDGGSGGRGGGSGGGGGGSPSFDAGSSGPTGMFAKIFGGLGKLKAGVGSEIVSRLAQNVIQVIDDTLQEVMERGLNTNSLIDLYKDAALAGMSLQDYAKLLDENQGLLTRSSSLKDFNERISESSKELAKFGVFGQEATRLSATIQQSSSTLGVPLADLSDSTSRQIKVFETLRKTTTITADAFADLVREMKDNETIQNELLGLAPAERAARQEQLLSTITWGKQLGLTEASQRQLTDALIAQRRTTVKDRFLARGRVSQAFALAGVEGGDEARNLASKRMKTPEEEKRLTELLGNLKARSEELKQTGNTGMAFQIEAVEEKIRESSIGNLYDAAGNVKLSTDSGPVQKNADLGAEVGKVGQAIGNSVAVLEGISKSSLAMSAIGGAWMVANALAIGKSVAFFSNGKGILGSIGEVFGKGGGGAGGGTLGILSRLALAAPAVIGGGMALMDLTKAQEDKKKGVAGADEAENKAIGMGIGTTIGAGLGVVLSGFIGAFTGGLGLLASGAITTATASLGGWLGNWLGSDSDAVKEQKKNSKELKSNTEQIAAQNKLMMPSSMITSDLSGLQSNVLSSAKAVAQSATTTQAAIAQVATPTPVQQTKVILPDVNKPEPEEPKSEAVKAKEAAALKQQAQDPATTLQQILDVLRDSLIAENVQIDLAGQLIRAIPGNKFVSNQAKIDQVLSTPSP